MKGSGEPVGTCCVYFKVKKPFSPTPILYLNGEGTGILNNACFPTTVSEAYGPPGETLLSTSTSSICGDLSDDQLVEQISKECTQWFGDDVMKGAQHLKTYRIPYAQPNQSPPSNFNKSVVIKPNVLVCGDHTSSSTYQGALSSGERAAEAALKYLSQSK